VLLDLGGCGWCGGGGGVFCPSLLLSGGLLFLLWRFRWVE